MLNDYQRYPEKLKGYFPISTWHMIIILFLPDYSSYS